MKKKDKNISNKFHTISFLNKLFLFLALLSFFILIFISIYTFSKPVPFEIKEMPYDFKIKDGVSFNMDADVIHFGGGPANNSLAKRSLILFGSSQDAFVKIRFKGPGEIILSDNNFILFANESKELNCSFLYPDLLEGNYSGIIYFEFYSLN